MYLYMYIIQGDDEMKILYKIILILALIIMCTSSICYAEQELPDIHDGGGKGIITGDGLPDLDGNYKPTVQMGDSSKNIVSTILGILTVLGIVVGVVGIALIGFNTILGSASEKAAGQEKYVGIVIAALLITGGSVIAKFIINFAENLI